MPDGRQRFRGAGTLAQRRKIDERRSSCGKDRGLLGQTLERGSATAHEAVALRFPHRRMLRSPRMAGGDENSRVRAFLPATRGRLLSESWKPKKYHAGPWPGAAGIRRDSYFGDS